MGHKGNKKVILLVGFILVLFVAIAWYLHGRAFPVLDPKGPVGHQERNLMFIALGLCAIVVIPVYIMAVFIAVNYRQDKKNKYSPNWEHDRRIEAAWWGVPILIIGTLSVITWQSSHRLDPSRSLASATPPLTIQVISLDWKWLFIYPKQKIASVNMIQIPVNTPINFQITSDAPMNSFWVPALGSQIYSMPGMVSQLSLEASQTGTFDGRSANISGQGFSGMNFKVKSVSDRDFEVWVASVKTRDNALNSQTYKSLALPSQNNPPAFYSAADSGIFGNVVNGFAGPGGSVHVHGGGA